MDTYPKFAVIGGGSWATAIVKMLCENVDHVHWYMRSLYAVEHIKKQEHNPNYLSSVEFNTDQLRLSNDINETIQNTDYIIFAIPSAFLKRELDNLQVPLDDKIIFSAIKGIVPETSLIGSAEQISRGDLTQPVELDTNDELGDLSRAIERMRASLQEGLERLRRRRR